MKYHLKSVKEIKTPLTRKDLNGGDLFIFKSDFQNGFLNELNMELTDRRGYVKMSYGTTRNYNFCIDSEILKVNSDGSVFEVME